jgi:predicted kinase
MSGHLIATMGAPGAGKSTWAQAHHDGHVISTDAIRHGADYRMVYRMAMAEVEHRLRVGQEVVFDATLASPITRSHLLDIAERQGATTTLVVFDTPLDLCVARQAERDIPVDEERVRTSWQTVQDQLEDIRLERWHEIEVV